MKTVSKVALIACLWLAVISTGTLGSIDTEVRLQLSHAWATGAEEIQIAPDQKARVRGDILYGVIGVGGKRYIHYDVGQSILMLPGDWIGSQLSHWFPNIESERWRELTVNFLVFLPLNVAAVIACFYLLCLFGFPEKIAGLGSLTWLLGTTFLYYAQVHQQNNQILLFVTLAYGAALAYVQRERSYYAILSGLFLGSAFLIRKSSFIHALTVLLFLVGCLFYKNRDKFKIVNSLILWIAGFFPLVLLGRFFDYFRYGSFWKTGERLANQQRDTDPVYAKFPPLPKGDPFTNEPHIGILGVLFSPAKSIFIYDPLLLPSLVLGISLWQKLSFYIKWYLLCNILNLGLHIALTSRLIFWDGDVAWGARYHITSVQLLLIPLLGIFVQQILLTRDWQKKGMQFILSLAIIAQLVSVVMPTNLEVYQRVVGIPGTRSNFRLAQRMVNIVCLVNSSWSKSCVENNPAQKKWVEPWNHVVFLPFNLKEIISTQDDSTAAITGLVGLIWIIGLILAIGVTIRFVLTSI